MGIDGELLPANANTVVTLCVLPRLLNIAAMTPALASLRHPSALARLARRMAAMLPRWPR